MSAQAYRWSCGRCKVSVGRMDGAGSPLPGSWTRSEGLVYCLSCSRARAGDAVVDAAPEAASAEQLTRLRRTALIEFEIARTPEASNRAVANACRTSSKAVAVVRDEIASRAPAIELALPPTA